MIFIYPYNGLISEQLMQCYVMFYLIYNISIRTCIMARIVKFITQPEFQSMPVNDKFMYMLQNKQHLVAKYCHQAFSNIL